MENYDPIGMDNLRVAIVRQAKDDYVLSKVKLAKLYRKPKEYWPRSAWEREKALKKLLADAISFFENEGLSELGFNDVDNWDSVFKKWDREVTTILREEKKRKKAEAL